MLPGKKYKPADFIAMALRRKWLLIIPCILGAYAGLIVSSQLTDMYQSEMLIQIVPQRVPDTYVRSTVTMRTEDRLNALSQQVMSRTELEKLIVQMNLYPELRKRLPMEDVVARMRVNVPLEVVKSQRDSRDAEAFYVRFSYPDPDIAMRVTEKVGMLYIDVNARDRGSLADQTNSFLETQLGESRARLEEQERKLEQFRERNSGRLPTQVEFNMQTIQATQLQLQNLVESLARDRDSKLTFEQMHGELQREPVATPAPLIVSAAANDAAALAGNPRQQLTIAREQLAQAETRMTAEHPTIIRLKSSIRDLEARVAAEDAKAAKAGGDRPPVVAISQAEQTRRERLADYRARIESLERQIQFKESEQQRLQRAIGDYQSRIAQTPGVESEWIALTRDYQTQQKSYEEMLAKRDQSKVAAELERRQIGEQFRVLDPARRPLRPTGVARIYVNAIAVVAGLMIGILLVAFLEFRDTTVQRATDIEEVFQLPVLALVPYLASDDDLRRQRRRLGLTSAIAGVAGILAGYGFWALQLWKHIA